MGQFFQDGLVEAVAGRFDADGDGRGDLTIHMRRAGTVRSTIYLSSGPALDLGTLPATAVVGPSFVAYFAGDSNRDGRADILTVGRRAEAVDIVLTSVLGSGSMASVEQIATSIRSSDEWVRMGWSAMLADLNCDSVEDVVVLAAVPPGNDVRVVVFSGTDLHARETEWRHWAISASLAELESPEGSVLLSVGDLTNDGCDDVVVGLLESRSRVAIVRGAPDRRFFSQQVPTASELMPIQLR
ncbi:MAG: hypothetical protein M3Y87_10125 [Myxococcota bacterium]|nr:hypothetical protein [Myxococcota bacterium]